MTEQKKEMRSPIETGCPDGFQYMHPTMRKNFGQWKYHEHLQSVLTFSINYQNHIP